MIARVHVSLKKSVLDPQGKAIQSALAGLGHSHVTDVRQGKFFDVLLQPGLDRQAAEQELERIARDVLSNPVIEDFRVELME